MRVMTAKRRCRRQQTQRCAPKNAMRLGHPPDIHQGWVPHALKSCGLWHGGSGTFG